MDVRNIKTKQPSKKLDSKRIGPLMITQKISSHAYRLELPQSLKRLHDVFSVKLLEPHKENEIPHRQQPLPPPVEIDGQVEHEVSAVLDSRIQRKKLQYLVEWAGYEGMPDYHTWEPAENLANASDYVRDFHRHYPHKPCPD